MVSLSSAKTNKQTKTRNVILFMNVVVLDFHWLNITETFQRWVSMQMEESMCVVMSKIFGFVDLLLSSDFVFYVEIHFTPASDNLLLPLVCFPPVWLSDTALIVFSCSACICSRVPLLFLCRRNSLCCVASSSEKICYFGTLASIFCFVLSCSCPCLTCGNCSSFSPFHLNFSSCCS